MPFQRSLPLRSAGRTFANFSIVFLSPVSQQAARRGARQRTQRARGAEQHAHGPRARLAADFSDARPLVLTP
jgi:hypothetical protein